MMRLLTWLEGKNEVKSALPEFTISPHTVDCGAGALDAGLGLGDGAAKEVKGKAANTTSDSRTRAQLQKEDEDMVKD